MGKEWLYWGGSGRSTKRGKGEKASSSPSGCMSAVFQLFDNLHQFQFAVPHQPSLIPDSLHQVPEEPNFVPKGVEAPRNSLESERPLMEVASSSSSTMKHEHNLNLPMGFQIKTSTVTSKSRTDDVSSECSSSPGTKTPNLVARLMGLDLLPELSSPRPSASSNYSSTPNPPSKTSSSSSHHCRSLPETPRISMARRSDVDNYHHRHSLQINKENIFTREEFELSSYMNAKLARRRECRQEDENKNSRVYAKQLVKQVKENISRRVGADITNTMGMGRKKEERRDEHLVLLKSKRPLTRMGGQDESTLSCSPRLRLLEAKNKPTSPSSAVCPKSQLVAWKEKLENEAHPEERENKLKKITSERYEFRLKKCRHAIKNKQEEPFIRSSSTGKVKLSDKKCRKTPLTNNLVNINAPKFLSFKKDPSPSSTTIKRLSQNQVALEGRRELCRSQSRSYNSNGRQHNYTLTLNAQYNNNSNNTTATGDETQVEYMISTILTHIGIDKYTPISIRQWYSPSHPLHPSIFHNLQKSSTTSSSSSSSRLMFDVADELLVEILKPHMNFRPWVTSITHDIHMCGWELIKKLSGRIRSFPGVDCRVLEDIDGLIDNDLCRSTQLQRAIAFEEEGEGIVTEIERDIVDTLVHETAMLMWHVRTERLRLSSDGTGP